MMKLKIILSFVVVLVVAVYAVYEGRSLSMNFGGFNFGVNERAPEVVSNNRQEETFFSPSAKKNEDELSREERRVPPPVRKQNTEQIKEMIDVQVVSIPRSPVSTEKISNNNYVLPIPSPSSARKNEKELSPENNSVLFSTNKKNTELDKEIIDVNVQIFDEFNRLEPKISRNISRLIAMSKSDLSVNSRACSGVSQYLIKIMGNQSVANIDEAHMGCGKYIIFGRRSLEYRDNPYFKNTISANLSIELSLVSTRSGEVFNMDYYEEIGNGPTNEIAKNKAIKKIMKKIKIDATIFRG